MTTQTRSVIVGLLTLTVCTGVASAATVSLNPDDDCNASGIGGTVIVYVDLSDVAGPNLIVGGQFFLEYDNTVLGFISMAPGDAPFTREIHEDVDETATATTGTIDYLVGIPDTGAGTTDDTTMAVITFEILDEACSATDLVRFRSHTPPTLLGDDEDNGVSPTLVNLPTVTIDHTAPVVTCPAPPSPGLIISEIMDGTWPRGLPKFVELTNCSDSAIDLSNYSLGNINNGASTMWYDALVLSVTLAAGDSYVVSYENGDSPGHGTFFDVYGFDPDNFDQGNYIDGNDVLVLFDGAGLAGDPGDGSVTPVVDVYGVVGVDGVGQPWEYTDGYSYRNPYVTSGNGGVFVPAEWTFGGAYSLYVPPPGTDYDEQVLMLALTTPGTHVCAGGIVVNNDADVCEAEVTLTASATDNCDGALSGSGITFTIDIDTNGFDAGDPTVSGSGSTYTFPVGTWPVQASIADSCGNLGTCAFTVTVIDNEPPTATQGSIDSCYPTAADAEAAAIAATTNRDDNCTLPGNLNVIAWTVGDCTATVTVLVSDEGGNSVSFDYGTRIDNTPPEITCPLFPGGGDLIVSEVVDATLPGGLPKYVELTNCGDSPIDLAGYSIGNYNNGGTTLGGGGSTVLSGILAPGDSYVISYENSDSPGSGIFFDTYGFDPDNFDMGAYINGNDVIALFLADGSGPGGEATGDGSDATLIDVYGVIGVDGEGENWEYTDSYAYRFPDNAATNSFDEAQWFFAGANALETGDDAEELALILANTTPGTHGCSADLVVNADAGRCDAVVTYPTPTATDNCDPAPSVTCDWPSGSTFPSGTTLVTCIAEDSCGNTSTCGFSVTVEPFNEVVVNVDLFEVWGAGLSLTRCITFEVFDAAPIDADITFTSGGEPDSASGSTTILVPCGQARTCITARDKLHTLQRQIGPADFSIVGTQYVANFTETGPYAMGNALVGGNLDDSQYIDIVDFAIYVNRYGTTYDSDGNTVNDGDTPCGWTPTPQGPYHADINGDGSVDTADFTYIQTYIMWSSDADCGGVKRGDDDGPRMQIAVAELDELGLGDLAGADLNDDGWIDEQDIVAHLNGALPDDDDPVDIDEFKPTLVEVKPLSPSSVVQQPVRRRPGC